MLTTITEHGAVADGSTVTTAAIQAAINAVKDAGGGTVVVPSGIWLTGMLVLCSRLELLLQPGAVLKGSGDLADYPPYGGDNDDGDRHPHHLLVADGVHDLTIRGGGMIDGSGPAFWQEDRGNRHWIYAKEPRVSPMVEIHGCQDVRLENITLKESPGWTLHLALCDRVWLRGVRVDNHPFGPNNDGFDINGCRDVFVSDCHIDTCDDAIVLKTTHDSRSCERITVTNCVLRTNCAALKCGTESHFDYRHITFSNCVVYGSTRAFACYAFDGATIEQVTVSNITCDTDSGFIMNHPIHLDTRKRKDDSKLSTIRDIVVSGFSAKTDGRLLLTAADGCTIDGIQLRGVQLSYPLFCDPAPLAPGIGSAQCSKHSPEARGAQAAVVCDGVTDLLLDGLQIRWPTSKDCPGWGGGQVRIENGGERRFGPADIGDDCSFEVLWARKTSGRFDARQVRGSDGRDHAWTLDDSGDLFIDHD
jgi:hypothetical protein